MRNEKVEIIFKTKKRNRNNNDGENCLVNGSKFLFADEVNKVLIREKEIR
jgi:hypothetical protein